MIPVAADHVTEVPFMPFGEQTAVIVDDFPLFPRIERLVHHREPH